MVLAMSNDSTNPSSSPEPSSPDSADPADRSLKPLVMIVDDEQQVLAITRRLIERLGYRVLAEADPRAALARYSADYAQISCVLLDLSMRPIDGLELFREMWAINPHVRAILCSGYGETNATVSHTELGLAGFLPKPYRIDELRQVLADVLRNDDQSG